MAEQAVPLPAASDAPVVNEPQHAIAPDQAEEDDYDEGFDGGSDRSSLSSLASEIRRGVVENGRVYSSYGREYGLPQDEIEMSRINEAHEKYFLLLGNKRYRAPIGPHPKHVLDLGTGTGAWAMDFCDTFPSCEVIGVDIAPIQPTWVPPNCRFEVDDVEQPWTFRKDYFDYIFSRDLVFAIRDWRGLIQQCYEHTKPGGWVELECIYGILGCDDGTLTEESAFMQYDRLVRQAAQAFGTPLEDPGRFKEWMEDAGFESVTAEQFKLPSNKWPKDPQLKMVGTFERENLINGLDVISLRIFQKGLGWTPQQTQELVARVLAEVKNPAIHAYYPFMVTYGRKSLHATS